ncbi:MAG TPA: extracellular solute-binding protein [Candidatus Binatia bacterium]|jgi:ABC-type Fe3+ transport system substrate-binding protein
MDSIRTPMPPVRSKRDWRKFPASIRRRGAAVCALVLAALLAACAARAADDADRIAKAKAEGQVVFYTTMGVDTSRPMTLAFEKKYPFLKVEVLRLNSERVFNRVVVEHQAGKVHADVVNMSVMPLLKSKRLLAAYRSPEAAAFPAKFRDPDDTWTGLVGNYLVIGYNTRLVPEANRPKDWFDLTLPWWKGKLAMDVEDFDWFGAMLEYLGPEKGRRLMQGLAAQQLDWRKGHSLLAQLVSAGEFYGSFLYAHRTQLTRERGAPIDWVKTSKPIVVSQNAVAVLDKAPRPNAARLLVDFLMSEAGQKLLYEGGQIPLRTRAVPASSPLAAEHLDLYPVSERVMERYEELKKDFNATFGVKQ